MSTLDWMIYAAAVSLLLSPAAWLLDRGLAGLRVPTRWVWLGALALSLGIPSWSALQERDDSRSDVAVAEPRVRGSSDSGTDIRTGLASRTGLDGFLGAFNPWTERVEWAIESGTGSLPRDPRIDLWVVRLWVGTSLLLAVVVVSSMVRLARRARSWPREEWLGRPVRVSTDTGPATWGLLRPEIVVPRRMSEALPRDLELVLVHEEEHARAFDPLVQAIGLLFVLAAPWNPLSWWQLRRLRQAVETDCDHRVLGRGVVSAREYGDLLIRVGSQARGETAPLTAMSGSLHDLDRRLRALRTRRVRAGAPLATVSTAVATGLIVVACSAAPPASAVDAEEMRIEMFFAALRVELFRSQSGRLPLVLVAREDSAELPLQFAAAGPMPGAPDIEYRISDYNGFQLAWTDGQGQVAYDSALDNPFTWIGLDPPRGLVDSWNRPELAEPTRRARLRRSLFAEALYRDRATYLQWPDEPSTEALRLILSTVEGLGLEMTPAEIEAAEAELRELESRASYPRAQDLPRIWDLQKMIGTRMRLVTPAVLQSVRDSLDARAPAAG